MFEAQWMVNHSEKLAKDQLDIISKIIVQTSDGNFVGQNVLNAVESGDIWIHEINRKAETIQWPTNTVTAIQNYGIRWQALGNQITSISESMMGQNPPSGTAWRQTEALLRESHSLFEVMTENKGLDLEKILREYIIPHLKKKMDNAEELAAILDKQQIEQLDAMFVPSEAIRRINKKNAEAVLNGELPIGEGERDQAVIREEQKIQNSLNLLGNQRFIKPSDIKSKTWKEALKDLEWDLECEITGESKDKQAVLTTLSSIFQTIASNPMVLQDPDAKMIFNKILEETGDVSPVELSIRQLAGQPVTVAPPAAQPPMEIK